jgi:uncharacterized membrane protein YhhN
MPKRRNTRLAATAGYLGLAALDTYLAGKPGTAARASRHVTKPLLMPTLVASTELAAQDGNTGAVIRGTQAAQVFSWGGDLALLGRGKSSFLTGVGSFFVAHLCYIGVFAKLRDPAASVSDPGPKAAAATWLAAAPVMAIAAGREDPALRAPIAAYAAVLTTMFATSTVVDRSLPTSARRRMVAGTSLFLLSDSLLAFGKFLRKTPSPALESAVMATYTAGQWLIAEGAVAAAKATD